MKEKQNILLADCRQEEVAGFVQNLQYEDKTFQVKAHISNWRRTGAISELRRYSKYFLVALRYFLGRRKYGAVAAWQQFYALIFCFYCSVFRVKKTNMVAALNYTYKEKRGKWAGVYRWFMHKCMNPAYLDYIHVPSAAYADIVSRDFSFPRDRIIVTTFGVNDRWEHFSSLAVPGGMKKDGYALAIGRSNRDYDFLIHAWSGIDYPLVIISDTYKGSTDNENVTILRDVVGEASYPWIASCGVMIVPIDDETICSGDTVLLTAMSAKRRIVVTAPSTLAEMYVKDKKNALLAPKTEKEFCDVVRAALDSEVYRDLGDQARESFLTCFSRESMGLRITQAMRNTTAAEG